MSTEEFAPFESRGLGSMETEASVASLETGRVLAECVTLVTRLTPQWVALGLTSGGLVFLVAYCSGLRSSGFVTAVAMMLLLPATLAAYYRLVMARKEGEGISFLSALTFGAERSIRMLATYIVLSFTLGFAAVLWFGLLELLGKSTGGAFLSVPLSIVSGLASVYFALRWQLAPAVCVVENRKFFDVLRRSYQLTENRLLPLFLIALGSGLLYFGAAMVVTFGIGLLFSSVSNNLANLALLPLFTVFYLWAWLFPLTANFLCYYYLSLGGPAPGESEFNESVGFSRTPS